MVLKELRRLADLPKKNRLFDWKGHNRIDEQLTVFKKRYGYKPSTILYFKDAYFIETNVPAVM